MDAASTRMLISRMEEKWNAENYKDDCPERLQAVITEKLKSSGKVMPKAVDMHEDYGLEAGSLTWPSAQQGRTAVYCDVLQNWIDSP